MGFRLGKKSNPEDSDVLDFCAKIYPDFNTEMLHIDIDVLMCQKLSKITITQEITKRNNK